MSLVYLLDTNVVSEPLRPAPNPNLLARLQRHQGEIALCSIVWHELLYGSQRLAPSARRTVIEDYLYQVLAPTFPLLVYDTPAATWHARERARLVGIGKTPAFAAGQIAAIAATNNLVLVTFNTADFADFAQLQVADWRA